MCNRDWNSMDEQDFDELLQNSLSEPPPDDMVRGVTPWRAAMNCVLIGLALTAITLNFCLLNYILPTIGVISMLLGFRTLRRENGWFRVCYILAVIRTACQLPLLALNATICQQAVYSLPLFPDMLTALNAAICFALIFCLWGAFRAVQRKAGLPAHAGGTAALMVWYALICLLALIQYAGMIVVLALLVVYILCIRALFKLSKQLDEAGYVIQAAPVRMTDRTLVGALLAVLAAGVIGGYLFLNSYPMEWTVVEPAVHSQVEGIKAHLAFLGFPEEILDDLTVEDVRACDGALRVVVDVDVFSFGEDDAEQLCVTGIAVELSGEREQWKLFHHFRWLDDPGFYGTEAIQLWPASRLNEGWSSAGEVTGRVLYTEEGKTYAAPYYSLGSETYTSSSIFWGERTSTDIFAVFSMPGDGENHRGYISYAIQEMQDGWVINSWVNYVHQRTWMQYPVLTAKEQRIANSFNTAGAFDTVQDALQFYPTEDSVDVW